MSEERIPCLRCGEPAFPTAEVCPHCRMPALVDVVAPGVQDARLRYQAARAVVALGIPGVTLVAAQAALAAGTPVVQRVNRATARRVLEILAQQRLDAREQAAPAANVGNRQTPPRRGFARLVLATVLLALGLGLPWWLTRSGSPAPRSTTPPSTTLARATPPPASADPGPRPLTTAEIAEKALPSVIAIRCGDAIGSGFFYSSSAALTNNHVCPGPAQPEITFSDGRKQTASIGERNAERDTADVSFTGNARLMPPATIGDAMSLKIGDRVVLVGSPRGLDFTVHEGRISSTFRNHLGVGYLQFDANVNPGNSGGPLLDDQGRVVGIVSMMVSNSSGLGFALPINYEYGRNFMSSPTVNLQLWSEALQKIADEDRRAVIDFRAAFREHFGIVGARFDKSRDRLIAAIVRRGGYGLGIPNVTLEIEQDGRTRCRIDALADGWGSWSQFASRSGGGDARYLQWLTRNDLVRNLYVATVDVGLCGNFDKGAPSIVILRPADPKAERVRMSSFEG